MIMNENEDNNDNVEDYDNDDVDDEEEDDGGCFNWVAMIAMIRSCSDWRRSIVCAIPGFVKLYSEISRDMNKLSINRTILSARSSPLQQLRKVIVYGRTEALEREFTR